jgi:glycine betaine/choline ABC-type transport system substrate-binding protein
MRRLWPLLAVLLAVGCGDGPETIVVGAKNFTEQRVLGELLAQTLERAGFPVRRRLDLGGTFVCDAALRSGQIDVYVEYTGTALGAILKEEAGGDAAAAVLARVRTRYAGAGLTWLDPLGFDNTFALVMRAFLARFRPAGQTQSGAFSCGGEGVQRRARSDCRD